MEQMINTNMNDGMMMDAAAGAGKTGKGMMVGMIACAVLAVGGIGFGDYEMTQAHSAKQQISDLKVEIKNTDGSTTTLETDKIEVKEDTKTVTITDTAAIGLQGFDPSKALNWTGDAEQLNNVHFAHQTMAGYGTIGSDGKSIVFSSIARNLYPELPNANSNPTISSLGGKIVDFYVGGFGQGTGYETLFMILEDGSVEYVPLYYAIKNNDYAAHKADGVSGVVRFSASAFPYGVRTIGIKADGSWYDMHTVLDIRNSQYYNGLF